MLIYAIVFCSHIAAGTMVFDQPIQAMTSCQVSQTPIFTERAECERFLDGHHKRVIRFKGNESMTAECWSREVATWRR